MRAPANPLAATGEVVGRPQIRVEALLGSLGPERVPLALVAGSPEGWFGGVTLVAWDPAGVAGGLGLKDAAGPLESAFECARPVLAAALVTYDGTATLACYDGGAILLEQGWVSWGTPPSDLRDVMASAADRGVAAIDATVPLIEDPVVDTSAEEYRSAVESVRESIAQGEVYVVNLTARVSGGSRYSASDAFAALRQRANADMGAFLEGWSGDVPWLVSASPERFVRITGSTGEEREIEVSPIKGTAPRGSTPATDAASRARLSADEKELAEHVMIVDLERNDIGTACVPGSVRVDPMYEVRTTPYCHQLVSTVRGSLRPQASFADVLAAAFPCGSVTGAPKSSALRIIDGLERSSRGAYCGSLLVAVPGQLDSSVLIRTLEGESGSSRAVWGTGCGITYESDSASEWLELVLKASPALGDGSPPIALRETMRVVAGRAPLLDRHLARLASGGCGPGILRNVREKAAEKIAPFAGDERSLRLGVTVTADGSVEAGVTDAVSTLSVPGGVRYEVVTVDRVPALPPAAAKPAARRFWDLAHSKATRRGAHQAVLATPEGVVVDGSTANVWLCREGKLLTPPTPPAIAGVARGLVFDVAASLGIPAAESVLTTRDLEAAEEVFFSNAHGGVALAADRGGPIGEAIASAFEEVMAGGR